MVEDLEILCEIRSLFILYLASSFFVNSLLVKKRNCHIDSSKGNHLKMTRKIESKRMVFQSSQLNLNKYSSSSSLSMTKKIATIFTPFYCLILFSFFIHLYKLYFDLYIFLGLSVTVTIEKEKKKLNIFVHFNKE